VVLAIGSVAAGYAGIGGRFEHFLEPAFAPQTTEVAAEGSVEATLMLVSIVVAFAGIGIATYYFLKNVRAAAALAARFAGLRLLLQHKYYVDEIYDAAFVRPMDAIAGFGDRDIEQPLINGAVMETGIATSASAAGLSLTQSGYFRNYVLVFVGGAVVAAIVILVRASF
jgi:NADH-quinone oxidoreductase subunit L